MEEKEVARSMRPGGRGEGAELEPGAAGASGGAGSFGCATSDPHLGSGRLLQARWR
ncbi:MAG: hypothetical protein H6668_13135 [Ardenticatenaceae bacterium]|nr:hypothetical protein [Ardenticatenaceae bacterium]